MDTAHAFVSSTPTPTGHDGMNGPSPRQKVLAGVPANQGADLSAHKGPLGNQIRSCGGSKVDN